MKKYIYNALLCTCLAGGMCSCGDEIELEDVKYPSYILSDLMEYKGYALQWAEEFDKDGLPSAEQWSYEEGYRRNSEWQDYKAGTLEHSEVKDGNLILRATVDPHEGVNPWTGEPYQFKYSSASVKTGPMQYGRIDIVAKIPCNLPMWPQIWMKPVYNQYGGEAGMTIMEYTYGGSDKHNTIQSSLHTYNTSMGVSESLQGSIAVKSLDGRFHLYSLVWGKKKIEILFDNESVLKYTKTKEMDENDWPFNQPFNLYLSLAAGGTKGGTDLGDDSLFPQEMEIKYVRYYKPLVEEPDDEEGNGDDDGEEEEKPVVIECIPNGGFEEVFAEGKNPEILKDSYLLGSNGEKFEGNCDKWSAKDGVKMEVKMEGDNHYLVYNGKVPNWWSAWVRYPIQNVPAGQYMLRFRIKNNQAKEVPFAACIAYFATTDDIACKDDNGKQELLKNAACLYINDGKQTLIEKNDNKPMYPIITGTSCHTEWKEYEVEVDIPANVGIMLNFGLNLAWSAEKTAYTATVAKESIEYYLDDVSLSQTITPVE